MPFFSPEDLPNPGIEPMSPELAGRFFTTDLPSKPNILEVGLYFHFRDETGHKAIKGLGLGLLAPWPLFYSAPAPYP